MVDQMVSSEVILSVYIFTFLVGLPANILALHAFIVKIRKKPTPTGILLLNLTVSDLLFLLFLPFRMHEAASGMRWNLSRVLCSVTTCTFFSTIYTSSLLLMAVSVVRYVAAAFPLAYRQLQKPLPAVVASAVIWTVSLSHCSLPFVILHHPALSNDDNSVCYDNFTGAQLAVLLPVRLEMFFVLSLAPLLVCVFCYLQCIRILYTRPRISGRQKRKALGMSLGTLAVFLVCVIPFNFSHVMGYFQGSSPQWRHYTLLLSTFNTCLDPIIYSFSSYTIWATNRRSILKVLGLRKVAPQRDDNTAGQEDL